jgi:hypothetical protein
MDRMRLRLVRSRRPWTCSILLACTLLSVAACDPGYDYRPVGWQRSDRDWIWSDKNLEIRMFPVGSLIASDGLIPEIVVRDLAGRPIVVEGSTLITKRRQYSASIATKDLRYRTVKPGGTLRMPIFFDFDGPIYKVLDETFQMDLAYRIGQEQLRTLHIRFVRK